MTAWKIDLIRQREKFPTLTREIGTADHGNGQEQEQSLSQPSPHLAAGKDEEQHCSYLGAQPIAAPQLSVRPRAAIKPNSLGMPQDQGAFCIPVNLLTVTLGSSQPHQQALQMGLQAWAASLRAQLSPCLPIFMPCKLSFSPAQARFAPSAPNSRFPLQPLLCSRCSATHRKTSPLPWKCSLTKENISISRCESQNPSCAL